MYTFEDAINKYKSNYLTNLFGLLRRYDNIYTDEQPFFCPYCGWYYPHNNWPNDICPSCKGKVEQVDNRFRQLGFFS